VDNNQFQELVLEQFQNINGALKELNKKHSNLEAGQQRLESRVGKIEEGQQRLENRVGGMENRLEGVEKGQQRIETRLENDVIEKIRALFDDREVQNDRLTRIENKLDRVANDTAYLVTEVAMLKRAAR